MDRRRYEEAFFKFLMIAATISIAGVLLLIVGIILAKGIPAMDMDMITKTPDGGFYLGKEGGVLNAIVGSLYLAGGATILSLIISLPVVLYINVYRRKGSRLAGALRFSFDVLWGVPSIVYGAFGFTIMIFFGLRASLIGGIVAVALLMLPIMSRTMDEAMRMIPSELSEASYSLGATRFETAFRVIARQGLPGILTALLVAFGRGIGDAASVIFTAGFSDAIPTSLLRPAATLPLAIFYQLGTPFKEVQERAYASALILTVIIFLISILTRLAGRRAMRNILK